MLGASIDAALLDSALELHPRAITNSIDLTIDLAVRGQASPFIRGGVECELARGDLAFVPFSASVGGTGGARHRADQGDPGAGREMRASGMSLGWLDLGSCFNHDWPSFRHALGDRLPGGRGASDATFHSSKTQIDVPEHFLGLMLGGVTGIVGALDLLNSLRA